jgi:hypothetical protein
MADWAKRWKASAKRQRMQANNTWGLMKYWDGRASFWKAAEARSEQQRCALLNQLSACQAELAELRAQCECWHERDEVTE